MRFSKFWIGLLMLVGVGAQAASPLAALKPLRPSDARVVTEPHRRELLVFWATWCPECRDKLTRILPATQWPDDFRVIAVGTEKDAGRVQSFIEGQKIAFPVLMDTDKALRKELKIFGVPAWAYYEKDQGGDWRLVKSGSAWVHDEVEAAVGFKIGKKE